MLNLTLSLFLSHTLPLSFFLSHFFTHIVFSICYSHIASSSCSYLLVLTFIKISLSLPPSFSRTNSLIHPFSSSLFLSYTHSFLSSKNIVFRADGQLQVAAANQWTTCCCLRSTRHLIPSVFIHCVHLNIAL